MRGLPNRVGSVVGADSTIGITMVEIMVAVVVFAIGIVPVFLLLSQSRRTTEVSQTTLQASTMISSMICAMKEVPIASLQPILDQELEDEKLPANLSLTALGIPLGPKHLIRKTQLRIVNQPSLPGERFSNPWGRILEIDVKVQRKQSETHTNPKKEVLTMKGYRVLESGGP